jgi:predicted RecA/RadA family phage recombinase
MAQTQEAVRLAEGRSVDYTPSSDVAAGQVVVQGSMVGVAATPIPANTKGALAVEGLFSFKKKSGDTFAAGGPVYWDDTANEATTTLGSNKFCGFAAAAAGSSATEVFVSLRSIDWAGLGAVGLANLADVADTIAYTAGKILVADGTKYDDVAVSGDATLGGDGALTLNAAHQEQVALIPIAALGAGADLSAAIQFAHPRAATLVSVGYLAAGTDFGTISDASTSVFAITDGAGNTIVSKTYNTATQPMASALNDLGALDDTHKVLTAGETVSLAITNGTTAKTPAGFLVIRFIPTNA